MGYMMVYGECLLCWKVFAFNPELVPSHTVEGVREPICQDCITSVNSTRVQGGLEPLWVSPDAYSPTECF